MDEQKLKQAFDNVKQDIFSLGSEISALKLELIDLKNTINSLAESLNSLKIKQIASKYNDDFKSYNSNELDKQILAHNSTHNPTHNPEMSTDSVTPTHTPTDNLADKALLTKNTNTSTGNRGVPTDRQTDRQTDELGSNLAQNTLKTSQNDGNNEKPIEQTISEASEILENLDNIKKQIRLKFKSITPQEMLVFSTIFQLEDQEEKDIDYHKIALKLGLSQSSIRDYALRLINKGIPIQKLKLNNKKITLKISPELRKIVSLNTILKLREI